MLSATLNKNIATVSIVFQPCHEFDTLLWLYTNTHKLTLCSYSTIYKKNRAKEAHISSIFLWFELYTK
jgi:hypothetical protein